MQDGDMYIEEIAPGDPIREWIVSMPFDQNDRVVQGATLMATVQHLLDTYPQLQPIPATDNEFEAWRGWLDQPGVRVKLATYAAYGPFGPFAGLEIDTPTGQAHKLWASWTWLQPGTEPVGGSALPGNNIEGEKWRVSGRLDASDPYLRDQYIVTDDVIRWLLEVAGIAPAAS